MHRMQIYLDGEEARLLGQAVARTGASRSELIRRAIRGQYAAQTARKRLAALRASAGTWRGYAGTGAQYVDDVRGDLAERFEQVELG